MRTIRLFFMYWLALVVAFFLFGIAVILGEDAIAFIRNYMDKHEHLYIHWITLALIVIILCGSLAFMLMLVGHDRDYKKD